MPKMKCVLVVIAIIVTTLLCLDSCSTLTTASLNIRNVHSSNSPYDYTLLNLDLRQPVTTDSYHQLLQALRDEMASETSQSYGIPVTRPLALIPPDQRFIYLNITNGDGKTITVVIDGYTSYIVQYQTAGNAFILSDDTTVAKKFMFLGDTNQTTLPFGSTNYTNLENSANKTRGQIELGFNQLGEAIGVLCETTVYLEGDISPVASTLLVVCQMISDAARYYPIEVKLSQTISSTGSYNSLLPGNDVTSMEDQWVDLSQQILLSNQGVFSKPVRLLFPGKEFDYMDFNRVDNFLRSAVGFLYLQQCYDDEGYPSACQVPEPTVYITIGMIATPWFVECISPKDDKIEEGNTVILDYCNDDEVKQQWIIKTDGTIRSAYDSNWCLGGIPAAQITATSAVQIFSCNTVLKEYITWQYLNNGTILQHYSYNNLYLGVKPLSDDPRTMGLVLDGDNNLPEYIWYASRLSMDLQQIIIAGLHNNLCIQSDQTNVLAKPCQGNIQPQLWMLDQSGIITSEGIYMCVATRNDTNLVFLDDCYSGEFKDHQVWVFENDGTIRNLITGLVMDVDESDPDNRKIITSPYNGSQSQKWRSMLSPDMFKLMH